jgi:hypothetical protein
MWLSANVVSPSLEKGFHRLIDLLSQLWKQRAVKDPLQGEEDGAVKFRCKL